MLEQLLAMLMAGGGGGGGMPGGGGGMGGLGMDMLQGGLNAGLKEGAPLPGGAAPAAVAPAGPAPAAAAQPAVQPPAQGGLGMFQGSQPADPTGARAPIAGLGGAGQVPSLDFGLNLGGLPGLSQGGGGAPGAAAPMGGASSGALQMLLKMLTGGMGG